MLLSMSLFRSGSLAQSLFDKIDHELVAAILAPTAGSRSRHFYKSLIACLDGMALR